jgi:Tfp pilus assembly protein PilX
MKTAMIEISPAVAGHPHIGRLARHGARRAPYHTRRKARQGATALIAMLFLVLLTTLSLGLYATSTRNVQTAANFSQVASAQAAAESGLRWMDYRFQKMQRPKTTAGTISSTVASTLWPTLRDAIVLDLENVIGDDSGKGMACIVTPDSVTSSPVYMDGTGGPTFTIKVRQLSAKDGPKIDERYVRVTSIGKYRNTERAVSMDFLIDKKSKYSVVGKVPLQLGRNALLEGPVGMGTASKFPPVLMLTDFAKFDTTLETNVKNFYTHLKGSGVVNGKTIKNHDGFDNRISVNNADEYLLAQKAGYFDYNGDAYIDEYDLFLRRFDKDGDKAITKVEFTNPSTGQLYQKDLFDAIDQLAAPLNYEDRNGNGVLDTGEDANGNGILDHDSPRLGYKDGIIDNKDGYAKARGQVNLAVTSAAWSANLASSGKTIQDVMMGPIASSSPTEPALRFGVPTFDLAPANFEQATVALKNRSGLAGGTASRPWTGGPAGLIANTTLALNDCNGGVAPPATSTTLWIEDKTPWGSQTYQAMYKRPVFKNLTLRNVIIPKGLNPLFESCTFEGVTYVDMTRNITNPSGGVTTSKDDGMTWSKRMKAGMGTFSNTTVLTTSNSLGYTDGNNIRFNNCNFKGPLAGGYATAYTHFSNSWEFTGSTNFDNVWDQSATILSPQVNIEMGAFEKVGSSQSRLVGVVVVGNIDIRGCATIDGSIIVTGDGAGSTTLGYFGPNDGDTDPDAGGALGVGRLNLRYNPNRVLPDGINIAVDLAPQIKTYREGY